MSVLGMSTQSSKITATCWYPGNMSMYCTYIVYDRLVILASCYDDAGSDQFPIPTTLKPLIKMDCFPYFDWKRRIILSLERIKQRKQNLLTILLTFALGAAPLIAPVIVVF